jgi:ATP-dependent DNA helicase RecG
VLSLQDSVSAVPGVGPKTAENLATLNILSVEDLLTYYPLRYDNFEVQSVQNAKDQEKITIKGTVMSEPVIARFGYKKNRLSFRLMVNREVILVTFFNQPYLKSKIELGRDLAVFGKWDGQHLRMTGSKLITVDTAESHSYSAVYPTNKNVKKATIKKSITAAFKQYENVIPTLIPESLRQQYHLMSRKEMIREMHFPTSDEQSRLAKRSATYEEFFLFQLRLQATKRANQKRNGLVIKYHNDEIKSFIGQLPYELTKAQKRVVNEICRDLLEPVQMNRLLQGDVGSGKTIVAAIAIYAAITAGYQAALMVPTEILAEQHAQNLAHLFEGLPVNVGLLTGSLTAKQHRILEDQIRTGAINLIIGTHALIQDSVEYANLGLIITDEQHRFGVNQRQKLREKGDRPDVLAMTATPIPRTLAITAYGEMDVSIIDELPAGRLPIQTHWLRSNQNGVALEFVAQELKKGAQVYIVTPLIEESEALDVQNATALYEQLAAYFEPQFKVGLLHGRLSNDDKDAVMEQFKANELQVLVSTTVIEVGVDVANATVMMIYDADRFGLAQLHQLRGRVGRGKQQSYCILLADPKNEVGVARMQTMVDTTDGFVVAQKDMELRGSGDILGQKQSGVPEFKIGDPVGDLKILEIAQHDAAELLKIPHWDDVTDNIPLVAYLKRHQLQTHFD